MDKIRIEWQGSIQIETNESLNSDICDGIMAPLKTLKMKRMILICIIILGIVIYYTNKLLEEIKNKPEFNIKCSSPYFKSE